MKIKIGNGKEYNRPTTETITELLTETITELLTETTTKATTERKDEKKLNEFLSLRKKFLDFIFNKHDNSVFILTKDSIPVSSRIGKSHNDLSFSGSINDASIAVGAIKNWFLEHNGLKNDSSIYVIGDIAARAVLVESFFDRYFKICCIDGKTHGREINNPKNLRKYPLIKTLNLLNLQTQKSNTPKNSASFSWEFANNIINLENINQFKKSHHIVQDDTGKIEAQALVSKTIILKIKELIDKDYRGIININGEDDLVIIPIILFCPVDSYVLYGAPEINGIKMVRATIERKNEVFSIFKKLACVNDSAQQ